MIVLSVYLRDIKIFLNPISAENIISLVSDEMKSTIVTLYCIQGFHVATIPIFDAKLDTLEVNKHILH